MEENQNKIKIIYIVIPVLIVISIVELILLIKPNKELSKLIKPNYDEELKLGDILFDSNDVSYDNTTSNLSSTTVQDTIDELYTAATACATNLETCQRIQTQIPQTCANSPFHLGDYIDMTPTSTSFTPDRTITGLDEYDTFRGNTQGTTTIDGILNPSYLNVWRVIKINPDCTVEVVSEYASDVNVKFALKVGYKNLVYYLNEIAKQYANTTYTLNPSTAPDGAFRNVGYDGQTKQITDTTRLEDTTLGSKNGAWYQKTSPINGEETLGGGDQKYVTDLKLLDDAGVKLAASTKGSTVAFTGGTYWLSSRQFIWLSANRWDFCARVSPVTNVTMFYMNRGSVYGNAQSNAVRPIVTLKSGLTIRSGNGTSSSHYQLSAS